MKNLKKTTSILILSTFLLSPVLGFADELDDKIKEQDQKIEVLESDQKKAEASLAEIEGRVTQVQVEVEEVLTAKTVEEQRLNDINTEVSALREVIAKRSERLKEQAVNVQTNQSTDNFLEAIINSESLNEAFSRAVALTMIVGTNNEIIEDQKRDQEKLEALQKESEERLVTIETKSLELKNKQQELVEVQLEQEVRINELQATVATEKSQKEKFQLQKEEAERQRQAQLKALEEQEAKEAAARQAALEQAKIAEEEQAAKESTNQAAATATVVVEESNQGTTIIEEDTEQVAESSPTTNDSGWISPVASISVSSPYGERANPTGVGTEFHDGIDLVGATGEAIYAVMSGTVVQTGFDSTGGGNFVIIEHENGYYSHYLHLSSIGVSTGQVVSQGTTIGGMGSTGRSTGTHLHFGIGTGIWSGYVNPAPFIGA